jgi:maleylacetate reductase
MDDKNTRSGFALDLKAHRVLWGWRDGEALSEALDAANIKRFLLITSPDLTQQFATLEMGSTHEKQAGTFDQAVAHVPEASIVEARDAALQCRADGLVAFGGGTALDTAKGVSNETGLPIIAIPTNFSGSEVTWNFGVTRDGTKHTVRNPAVLARAVIYDASFIKSLPLTHAVCSGINAVAHAIEALYAPEANPFTHAIAESGIRHMLGGLKALASGERPRQARAACLMGSWLCGESLSQVGMGLHHRVCHVLGGSYGLPHAQTHTLMLPYMIAFNKDSAAVLHFLSELFEGTSPAQWLAEFSVLHGAPRTLRELGITEKQISEIAHRALATPVPNPRTVTAPQLEAVLLQAFRGDLIRAEA